MKCETDDASLPSAAPQTINQSYKIDASKNNGAEHQFHEVVRGKQARKALDAEDCDECRAVRLHYLESLPI